MKKKPILFVFIAIFVAFLIPYSPVLPEHFNTRNLKCELPREFHLIFENKSGVNVTIQIDERIQNVENNNQSWFNYNLDNMNFPKTLYLRINSSSLGEIEDDIYFYNGDFCHLMLVLKITNTSFINNELVFTDIFG